MDDASDVKRLSEAAKRLLIGVKEQDIRDMKNLGNDLLRNAAVSQSKPEIKLAMVCYALSKIYQKTHYRRNQMKWSEFEIDIKKDIRNAEEAALSGNGEDFSKIMDRLFRSIELLDSSFGNFVRNVTEKAMVRKGSTLYAMGFSLSTAAELTGASKWDLLRASGSTKMSDEEKLTKSLMARLESARRALA